MTSMFHSTWRENNAGPTNSHTLYADEGEGDKKLSSQSMMVMPLSLDICARMIHYSKSRGFSQDLHKIDMKKKERDIK